MNRGASRLARGGPVLLGSAATIAAAGWPTIGLAWAILLWSMIGLLSLPAGVSIVLPSALLFLVPADHIAVLGGQAQGFFVLGVVCVLALSTFVSGGAKGRWRCDWDLMFVAGIVSCTTVVHAGEGQVRSLLYWASALGLTYWLRGQEARGARVVGQVTLAMVTAGAIGAAAALVSASGILGVRDMLPGYEPADLDFSKVMGLRAVGLSGHPLRFGTLTMLSSLLALSWLTERSTTGARRGIALGAFVLSFSGLILSGARGAWLGFGVGIFVAAGMRARGDWRRSVFSIGVYLLLVGLFLWTTGLWSVIHERIFGQAIQPGSLAQRANALEAIMDVAARVPVFGVGIGGLSGLLLSTGLRSLNVENEYLLFFLIAGLPGLATLLTLGLRRLVVVARGPLSGANILGAVLVAAMFVDIGTYNLFSWSAGPCLFAAVMFLAMPYRGPYVMGEVGK